MLDLIGTLRWIKARVDMIFALVNATLTLQETGGTVTTTGAEQDVYRVAAPMGVFEPLKVQIDFTNQTAAETVVVRLYYQIAAIGNPIQKDEVTFAGVQAMKLKPIELEPNRHGIRVTLQRTVGGVQAYPWTVLFRN